MAVLKGGIRIGWACMHACMHAYIHTYTHTHIHTRTHTHIRTDRQGRDGHIGWRRHLLLHAVAPALPALWRCLCWESGAGLPSVRILDVHTHS